MYPVIPNSTPAIVACIPELSIKNHRKTPPIMYIKTFLMPVTFITINIDITKATSNK